MSFKDKRVLITGGLGFLGSNLIHKLITQGATVSVIDNLDPLYGGNKRNVYPYLGKIKWFNESVLNKQHLEKIIPDQDYIFHLAAQVSYIDSLTIPYIDLDLNAKSTLQLLEIVRHLNPAVRIIFSSSRMVLGKVLNSIYNEEESTNPLSLYGIHKLASEKYLLMYYNDFGIKSTIFRITNPYGPRQQIKHNKYSLPGWFIRCAMEGKTIKIFGDGNQIRDYVYVDDIINSMLLCALNDESYGQIINMGSGCPTSFKEMVHNIIDIIGKGAVAHVAWPHNYEKVETGDSIPDISKLKKLSGYTSLTNLQEGIQNTFKYISKEWIHYIE